MENAENALILLYDLCRLCLDEPGVDNIFKPVDWSQDILFYTGIKVTPADKLPQTICVSCRDTMNCIRVLKEIAIANDRRLKQISGYGDRDLLVTGTPSHLIIITPHTDDQNNPSIDALKISSSEDQSLKNRIVFESDDEDTFKMSKNDKENRRKRKISTEKNNCVPKLKVRTDLFDSSVPMTSKQINVSLLPNSSPCKKIEESNKTSTKKLKLSKSTTSSPCKKLEDSHKISRKKRNVSPTTSSTCKKQKDSQEISSKNINVSSSTTSGPCKKLEESQEASSSKQVPTSTSNEPTKTVIVDGKMLKVHKYEYECETCLKTFATHRKLYIHQLTHNKKVQCSICLKKFATKGDLQKHVRSHTGEKPYKCSLCDLSFSQNCTLKAHKEKLHNEPLSQT